MPLPLEPSTHQVLRELFAAQRIPLREAWKKRIRALSTIQVREDLDASATEGLLDAFFDLLARQIETPGDYARLRTRILSGDISAFTPDAACRMVISLKKTVFDLIGQDQVHWAGAEAALDEILLRMAEYCHEMRHRANMGNLQASEARFRTLIETMNEGFTAIDADDKLTFFNRRMERISGRQREDMIGKPVSRLYTEESNKTLADQLKKRRQRESSTYQLNVQNKDGRQVPVRISGAPLHDAQGTYQGSFAVITDISEQVETEKILRQRNDEIARLLESEKHRAGYFATINRVAQMALSTLDPDEIFRRIVKEVQESFGYQHVSFYLVEPETGQMVMRARAGQYEAHFAEGYRQKVGTGIVGTVVASGAPLLANDVASDPRRILAFPEEISASAELCVPIKTGDRVLGALDVISREKGIFSQTDQQALQILADHLAWVIHNARLYQETRELKEFSEQVLQTIPLPLLLLDRAMTVVFANAGYLTYHGLSADAVVDRPLEQSRPTAFLVTPEGRKALSGVFETGQPCHLKGLRIPTGAYYNRVVDMLITRLETAKGHPLALVVVEDITESLEKAYQSSLLRQISQTMQGILDSDRLLYAILTCVTAGTGLGFNRAILLQVDAERGVLEGKMGVGPANHAEASRIWSELARQNPSVEDILVTYDRQAAPFSDSALSRAAVQIRVQLSDPDDVLARAVRERKTFTATEQEALSISPALWAALGTHHFVVTPLVVQDRAVGVIVADNLYSGAPITSDSVDLLQAFAGHAALALENAGLYRQLEEKVAELQRTQEELVQSERLAVIGELSAQIAHEIRNPLATIGGFARAMLRRPDPDRIQTAARVIAEEVGRLEALLTDILNYTRPRQLTPRPTDVAHLIEEVHSLIAGGLDGRGITYRQQVETDLPIIAIDVDQFKQVLINLLKNAYQAMPDGGELRVCLRIKEMEFLEIEIRDTGEGMTPDVQEKLFRPYFTTKTTGTGLGLAISRQIVERHGGAIALESQQGVGTSVFIRLPLTKASPEEAHT